MKNLAGQLLVLSLLLIGCSNRAMKVTSASIPPSSVRDINLIPLDLVVPPVSVGEPSPGRRVRQTLPDYRSTEVHHLVYLPTNWEPGKPYPVIVEYPGNGPYTNAYGDISTGKVEGCNLGFGISGGEDYIWISMPFISLDGLHNQDQWWGDVEATKKYCIETVKSVCRDFGGDSTALILAGFSRGAIAVNYIGLHDEKIANLWLAFIAHSHYDGVRAWGYAGDDSASALQRLDRLGGRPQFISHEDDGISQTKEFLEQSGYQGDFTFVDLPYPNHINTWVLRDLPERTILRNWLTNVIGRK
jgi:hypothetical protein